MEGRNLTSRLPMTLPRSHINRSAFRWVSHRPMHSAPRLVVIPLCWVFGVRGETLQGLDPPLDPLAAYHTPCRVKVMAVTPVQLPLA
jgi:hypothetical protein